MTSVPEPSAELLQRAGAVRLAAVDLGQTDDHQRAQALQSMADALGERAEEIVAANREDLERSAAEGLAPALMARLKLDAQKLAGAIDGVRKVAGLPDPLGQRQLHRELDDGLRLERVSVPLGVVGVIFEARPAALMQIASLAIRSGNGALLKGGREARCTNEAVMGALKAGLASSSVSPDALALLTTRQESLALLRLDGLVDLIIPRGSNELVRFIQDNTRIPVLGHADGICHLYVDQQADLAKAVRVALDSKTQYPAACNAIETLLVHRSIAADFLAAALPVFAGAGVRLRGDAASVALGVPELAVEDDWRTEYLDLILAVKLVDDLTEATDHMPLRLSSHRSDSHGGSRDGRSLPCCCGQCRGLSQLLQPFCRRIPVWLRCGGGHQHPDPAPPGPRRTGRSGDLSLSPTGRWPHRCGLLGREPKLHP